MNRRTFFKRSLIAMPFALGGSTAYGRYIERHAVEVVERTIEIGLGEPLTAALLGDLHFDPLYETDYLEDVIARLNALSPDLTLFTGDFISDSTDRLDELIAILQKAQCKLGVHAVLGNHDHWVAADEIETALTSAGIRVLRNESIPLAGRANWYLSGIESYWSGTPKLQSIAGTPSHARHIVMIHEPDSFDLVTDPRIALQLSGHTHGGQIQMPGVGPLHLPTWGKKYPEGLYTEGNRKLYVNRGIGTVKRHFRVNCRPEITLLVLT